MEKNDKMVKENQKNIGLADTSKQSDDNFKEMAKICPKCNNKTFVNTSGCIFKCKSCNYEKISEYPPTPPISTTKKMLSLKIAQSSESEEESSSKKQEILESNPPIVNRSLLKLNSSLFDDDKSPEKSYLLRNGKVKPKKINKEPEVIQLSDSEDEVNAKNPDNTMNETSVNMDMSQTNSDEKKENNPNCQDEQNEKTNKISKVEKNKYHFKEWNIKKSDTISINRYLLDDNCSIKKIYTDGLQMKSKFTRLGGYYNDVEHLIIFNEKNGIDIVLKDGDYQIKITIGTEDIKYCAAMFHDPAFFFLIRLSDFTASLYAEELKKMDNFRKSFVYSKDDIVSTSLVMLFKIPKLEVANSCRMISKYFSNLSKTLQIEHLFDFISLTKSRDFLCELFKDENCYQIISILRAHPFNLSTKTILKYPLKEALDQTVITNDDLLCLRDGEFLNDTIIMFYLKYLLHDVLTQEQRDRVHIFNTFFYQSLTKAKTKAETQAEKDEPKDENGKSLINAAQRRHNRVKNWTRNVNIFEKDFLIIPIHKHVHWFLAIVCYPNLKEPILSGENTVENEKESSKYESHETEMLSIADQAEIIKESASKPIPSSNFYSNSSSLISGKTNTENKLDLESADEADAEDSNDTNLKVNKIHDLEGKSFDKMPIILILDSLGADRGKKKVIMTIKEYLDHEWKAKYPKTPSHIMASMFDTTVKVPLQQNYYDCGIFVLQYVQQFLSKPFEIFKMPIDLSQWFEQSVIQTKRMELRNLIFQLSKQMQSNNGHNKSVEQQSIEMLAVTGQPEVKKSKSNHDICENEAQSPKSSKKYKNLNEDEDIQIDENINFDDISVHKSKRKQTKTNDKANLISHKLPIKSASAATTNIKPQCEILFDQLMNDDINNNNNRNNDDNRQNDHNNDNETFSYKPKSFYGASENSKRQSNKKTYEIMNSLDNLN